MPINQENIQVEEIAIKGNFLNLPKKAPSITAECYKVNSSTGEVLNNTRILSIKYDPNGTFTLPDGSVMTHDQFYIIFKALIVSEMEKS